jgi:hypothetical protein
VRPAAVVLGSLAAPADAGLDALLGDAAASALRGELIARARRWAAAVAPDVAFEATTPGAAAAALHGHHGPVLLVSWDVPALDAGLAEAALADLAAGALATVGVATDGQAFIVGFARADPDLIELAGAGFDALVAAAQAEDAELGMLRHERRLVSPGDARALAADPLAPEDLVGHLRNALPVRRGGSADDGRDDDTV